MFDKPDCPLVVELGGVYNPATSQIESPRYEYGYDAQGNQTLLRDPLGRETWFTFDAQNCQVARTLPLGFGEDGIRGTGDDPVSWTKTKDEKDEKDRHFLFAIWSVGSYHNDRDAFSTWED